MTIVRCKKTIPLPDNAIVKKDTVTWLDKRGNKKTGILTPNGNVLVECGTFQIEYRDENGKRCRESTGLKTLEAARFRLAQRLAEVQRIKAGIITRKDMQTAESQRIPLSVLVGRYLTHLRSAGPTEQGIHDAEHKLNEIVSDCGFQLTTDIVPEKVEQWIVAERNKGVRTANTINGYVGRLKYFCNWAVQNEYMLKNPVNNVGKLNADIDRRKIRRALTADELTRLFESARKFAVQRPKQSNYYRPDDVELVYRLLAGTGLRSKELSLAVPSQFDFVHNRFRVDAAKTKNKRADILPVRPELIRQLKQYIDDRNIAPTETIFQYEPYQLLRWFYHDLKTAGIARRGADGRSVDIHSLRKTFGTMLASAGVPLTTVQRLMRHSRPEMTAKLYIDVEPIDMQKALEKLPEL